MLQLSDQQKHRISKKQTEDRLKNRAKKPLPPDMRFYYWLTKHVKDTKLIDVLHHTSIYIRFLVLKVLSSYVYIRNFYVVTRKGFVNAATYEHRNRACNGCEHQTQKLSRKWFFLSRVSRPFCELPCADGIRCPKWFMSTTVSKNNFLMHQCPLDKFYAGNTHIYDTTTIEKQGCGSKKTITHKIIEVAEQQTKDTDNG